ncbi:MAG: hypothetical protein HYV08_03605 [Deltaproteobacteria bacterium]|nr:hypothetical protein [Deltaproteobacteria bacterium]MBI3078625.1 hypothetical protein [Deltaproteobacteria bacterium]
MAPTAKPLLNRPTEVADQTAPDRLDDDLAISLLVSPSERCGMIARETRDDGDLLKIERLSLLVKPGSGKDGNLFRMNQNIKPSV